MTIFVNIYKSLITFFVNQLGPTGIDDRSGLIRQHVMALVHVNSSKLVNGNITNEVGGYADVLAVIKGAKASAQVEELELAA